MLVHEDQPFNAEPPRHALADALLTPLDAFYVRNHGPVPEIDAEQWRLTVDGLVARPLQLSMEELQGRFPVSDVTATLACAGNRRAALAAVRPLPGEHLWGPGAVSTARWTGVRLADILAAAGPRPDAAHVAFGAPDLASDVDPHQPFGASVPMGKALSPEVLLAWAMNGQPLPTVHGAPLRVVVPGWIGARSVKWLCHITAAPEPSDNYFQAVAYRLLPPDPEPSTSRPGLGIPLGPAPVTCDILSPDDGAHVPAGLTPITGYAYAGEDRTIARVDVSLDHGRTWTQANLDPPAGPWAWQHWHSLLQLPAGTTEVTARAWDTTGTTQPETPQQLWNPKGYANNSWARLRVHST
ncbi:sulfite oxidase [Streptacidiphilus griseoplanus]|uniref:sulfite oxidase n=1 Tax=Peterkaempfera griseoplana TaxID=66896 RepID=UPI000AA7D87F|nr:sulfite oxidase [Peterkaempfera griseoplana]